MFRRLSYSFLSSTPASVAGARVTVARLKWFGRRCIQLQRDAAATSPDIDKLCAAAKPEADWKQAADQAKQGKWGDSGGGVGVRGPDAMKFHGRPQRQLQTLCGAIGAMPGSGTRYPFARICK